MKAELSNMINGENEVDLSIIEESERNMLEIFKPQNWNIYRPGNMEIEHEVGGEKYVLAIESHIGKSLEYSTVFEFYSAVEFLKEKAKVNANN